MNNSVNNPMHKECQYLKTILVFIVSFAVLSTLTFAEEIKNSAKSTQDLTIYKDLTVDLTVASSFKIVKEREGAELKDVHADLLFYPYETYRQKVVSINTNRDYKQIDDPDDQGFRFSWLGFEPDYSFQFTSRLKTKNEVKPVTQRVVFPVLNVPNDVRQYLQETEMIDYRSSGIQQLASKLVEGEDDLYVVTFKIADWVKTNIKYDLNTATADAAQSASWVLENREGVCDELTNLFIAMLRSVGVPARFVTGIAYTTSDLFTSNWGPHGWAEVYFPGVGWVPFDVTYGQYGFLDATHLQLKHSIDSDKSSVEYEWSGKDIGVNLDPIIMNATVVTYGEKKENGDISVTLQVHKQHVGLGSFNLLEAVIENKADYYNPIILRIANSEKLKVYDQQEKAVLLKPDEKKKLYWIMKVADDLDEDYVYTFTVQLDIPGRAAKTVQFTADRQGPSFTLNDVDTIITAREKEEEKQYSRNVDLKCAAEKEFVYKNTSVQIQCILQNTGNTLLENLKVCLEEECTVKTLGIGEEQQLSFTYQPSETLGDHQEEVTAKNAQVRKSSFFTLKVQDKPSIAITQLMYPGNVSSLTGNFTVNFTLEKKSVNVPLDIVATIDYGSQAYRITMDRLEKATDISVDIDPNDLMFERNEIPIIVTYSDNEGSVYSTEEHIMIYSPPETIGASISSFLSWLFTFFDELLLGTSKT